MNRDVAGCLHACPKTHAARRAVWGPGVERRPGEKLDADEKTLEELTVGRYPPPFYMECGVSPSQPP